VRRFVLDASISLAWFIDNPIPSLAEGLRQDLIGGDKAIVPALWHLEMANGFVMAERRRTLAARDISRAMEEIGFLLGPVIESDTDFVSMKQAFGTARKFRLSAYDAVYLETSIRLELPLATLDQRLRAAASKAGVPIIR
jgi:predicted nucleic acid-binding protein